MKTNLLKYYSIILATSGLLYCGSDDKDAEVQSYRIGGEVTGLIGTLVIRNNGADEETIKENGRYYFDTKVKDEKKYNINIVILPDGQNCTIHHVEGTIDGADITDADIDCN